MASVGASPALAAAIQHAVQEVQRLGGAVTTEGLNSVATALVREAGAAGWRQYAAAQALSVRQADGQWADVDVADALLGLHPWNHAPRELPSSEFQSAPVQWKRSLRDAHTHIHDAVLGRPLDVLKQCVAIDVSGDAELANVKDAGGLSAWLRQLHAQRCEGAEAIAPSAALLTGPPAARKVTHPMQVESTHRVCLHTIYLALCFVAERRLRCSAK